MKRRKSKNRIKYTILFLLGCTLFFLTSYLFLKNLQYQKILTQKPWDIQVVNITTSDIWVYWKSSSDSIQNIVYREDTDDSTEYIEVKNLEYHTDYVNESRVFSTHIQDLKPDTKYIFKILSKEYEWDQEISFKTKGVTQEVPYPEILTGKANDKSLILVEMPNEKLMVDTQYHGTYAFDSKGKEFTASEYSRYITGEELGERLSKLISPKVYAASGANCKTNITISSVTYPPTKAKTIDIINRWVAGCPMGGYPETCYEDVYCRSLKYGINPAFAMAIWSHESGGSNYAYISGVEDFGIHGHPDVGVANFEKQIEYFLQYIAVPSYISSCQWSLEFEQDFNPTLPKEMIMWAARYYKGQCSDPVNLSHGYEYISEINRVYGWYTNSTLTWPFTVSRNSSVCDYSSSFINTAYNTCTSKGEPTDDPPEDPPTEPTVDDGQKKWLPITGIDNEGKRISPEVDRECEYSAGCICIWNYNIKPGESTKEASKGYVCTVSGEVVSAPTPKCGTRATTYSDSTSTWPSGSTLCEIGTAKPSTVDFPSAGNDISWECVSGSKSQDCKARVSASPLVCCFSNQTVSWIDSRECSGEVLEGIEKSKCVVKDGVFNIGKGTNFIQALDVVNYQDVPIRTAKELIEYSAMKIFVVGEFQNNEWIKVVKYSQGSIHGQDFNLESGKVYLVISLEDMKISFESISRIYVLQDLTKLVGWNLIPSSYFENVSDDSREILLEKDLEYISQIGVWDGELSSFNYTARDEAGVIYGDSLDIEEQQGVFVKIAN